MSGILMAGCYDFFLIKWIANVLGIVMSGLYSFFGMFGLFNIGLCIIVFTILCKMLLFPITLKQQKFTKVSAKMNPELQAIQKKYANKRDNDSMMKQQAETMALYEKYGTSPTGSCLPMVIQMFILFSLYAVIINIPEYVKPISEIYENASEKIVSVMDDYNEINVLYNHTGKTDEELSKIIENNYDVNKKEGENNKTIYDNLINLYATVKPFNDFDNGYDNVKKIINELKEMTDEDFDKLINEEKESKNPLEAKINLLEKYKNYNWEKLEGELSLAKKDVDNCQEQISDIYTLCGIDLSKSPSEGVWFALLIPILSFLTQWLSMKISTGSQPQMPDNPMASSMKVMSFTMPLVSAFFCYTLPSGLGLYWVMSAVVQIVQQLAVNHHFKNVDVDDIIKANIEKQKKKKERKGINPDENRIINAANMNAKSIKVDTNRFNNLNSNNNDDIEDNSLNKPSNYKKGSIASKANKVKEFNEKNNK